MHFASFAYWVHFILRTHFSQSWLVDLIYWKYTARHCRYTAMYCKYTVMQCMLQCIPKWFCLSTLYSHLINTSHCSVVYTAPTLRCGSVLAAYALQVLQCTEVLHCKALPMHCRCAAFRSGRGFLNLCRFHVFLAVLWPLQISVWWLGGADYFCLQFKWECRMAGLVY